MTQTQRTSTAPLSNDAPLRQKKKLLNGPHFTFTYPNGSVYEGAFKDGKLHGFGVYKYSPSGDFYEGEWKADMKHGYGRYVFAGGDYYVGTWYMGKKHGKGRFSFASGDEYYGSWKGDVMDGYGVFRLERNGDQYEGYWDHGLRAGVGVLRMGTGNLYDGEWADGKEEGFGVLQDINGSLYCGTWKAGLKDGRGVEKDKGVLFLVEYLGGYLISKQLLPPGATPQDDGWKEAVQRLSLWSCPPPLTQEPSRVKGAIDEDAMDSLKRTLDSWRKAYLALFDRVCKETSENGLVHSSFSPEEKNVLDLKNQTEMLKGRIQLLEAALGERMLEGRRVQATLREKDAAIQDLRLHIAHMRSERKRAQAGHSFLADATAVSTLNGSNLGSSATEMAEATALVAELQKQIVSLTQANYGQQQKLTVLSADNARLHTELGTMEDAVRELEDKVEMIGRENSATKDKEAASQEPLMSEGELSNLLRKAREENAELLVKVSHVEDDIARARAEKADLAAKLRESELARLATAKHATMDAKNPAVEEAPFVPAPLPDWRDDADVTALDAVTAVNVSLLGKEKHIAQLQQQNAELSRLVEEYRFQLDATVDEESHRPKHTRQSRSSKTGPPPSEGNATATPTTTSAELVKVETDLRKSRKKLKRIVEERNALALELYNAQCSFARLNRLLLHLRGNVVVAVALQDGSSESGDDSDSLVHVSDSDATVIEMPSASRSFRFDACFPSPVIAEHVFLEVKAPLAFVAQGFQSAFVGLGGCSPGTPNVLASLLPFLVEGLRSECAHHEQSNSLYTISYSVAATEIDARGTRDCFSGKSLSKVTHTDRGYTQPNDITFLNCGGDRVLDLLKQPLASHTKSGALSHLWMQVRVNITHTTEQTTRCGRLTLFDLGGLSSADEFDDFDAANARFMKRSLRQVDDTLRAVVSGTGTVPYAASVETSLLFDLLGGNSMTTIVGSISARSEDMKEQVLSGLTSLESLTRLHNGPFLQDFVGADELRWRDIVSTVSSEEQAQPSAELVKNVTL